MIMNIQQNTVSENNFEQCIKCTICTVYCPVAAVNPDYPGPKQAGPDGERLRLKQPDFFDSALKYCLNCKRCEVACPSNVRIGDIIQAARIKYGPQAQHLAPELRARQYRPRGHAGHALGADRQCRRGAQARAYGDGQGDGYRPPAHLPEVFPRDLHVVVPQARRAEQQARSRTRSPISTAATSTTTTRSWARICCG